MKRGNRGQATIFIIVAIFLVGALFVVIFARSGNRSIIPGLGQEVGAENFIDSCIRQAVKDKVEIMIPQGGPIEPIDYKLYNNVKVNYLCKNVNNYDPCINQYPLYVGFLEKEIKNNIQQNVNSCFSEFNEDLKSKGYDVSDNGKRDVEIVLKPGSIDVQTATEMTIQKGDVVQKFSSFSTTLNSPLYDMALVAQEIVSQEARFCYFEYVGYSILYNDFDVRTTKLSDETKIYTIKYLKSNEVMNIAIRGCAIPAGY